MIPLMYKKSKLLQSSSFCHGKRSLTKDFQPSRRLFDSQQMVLFYDLPAMCRVRRITLTEAVTPQTGA